MSDNEKYITTIEDGELKVKAKELSGNIKSVASVKYITTIVETDHGDELAVKVTGMGGGGGGGYTLPTATATRLGGVKVGQNLSVEADGTLNAQAGSQYELPPATVNTLGGIKVGQNLSVEADGTLNAQAGGGDGITRTYTNETGTTIETDIDFSSYDNIIVKKNGTTLQQDQIVHTWENDVNPSLTADGTVGGDDYAAEASSEYSYQGTTSYVYTIFNPSFETQGDVVWWTGNVPAPWWVTYYTPDAVKCKKVVFMNEIMTPATGKTGKIQGSNDNSTWVDLANVSIPNNDAGTITEVQVNSNTAYKYFRFYFTESYAQGCSFQQITIYSEPSVIVRDYNIEGSNIVFTNALVGTDTIVVQATKSYADTSLSNITNNGKLVITSMAAPSEVYDELSWTTDDQVFTAPANGWVVLFGITVSRGEPLIYLCNNGETHTNSPRVASQAAGADAVVMVQMPVKSGDKFACRGITNLKPNGSYDYYNLGLKFFYLEGNKQESN